MAVAAVAATAAGMLGLPAATLVAQGGPPSTTPASSAPSWVQLGTRVTYATAFATVDGRFEMIEDPQGTLVDPTTGRRYREVFTQLQSTGGTGSGAGLSEATIVGIDGADVVIARTWYLKEPQTGTYVSGGSSGEKVSGAVVPGLWIHPTELSAMRTTDGSSRLVLHGPITVAGTAYEAVSIVDPTPSNYSFFAYDSVTGVLLVSALRTGVDNQMQMSTSELAGIRQLDVPGLGGTPPAWVTVGRELAYEGSYDLVNPMDASTPGLSTPADSTVEITAVGVTWASYESTFSVSGFPPSNGTGVTGGAGPYWWDPASLAAMHTGQVLDRDPVSGLSLTVGDAGSGPGGPVVAMIATMPGLRTEVFYDVATGVMVAGTSSTESLGTTSRMQLVQMP